MNTPHNPEAVEAAMKWAKDVMISQKEMELVALDPYDNMTDGSARILSAEVERLRAECEQLKHERNIAAKNARVEIFDEVKRLRGGAEPQTALVQVYDIACAHCQTLSPTAAWFNGGYSPVCPACGADYVCGPVAGAPGMV